MRWINWRRVGKRHFHLSFSIAIVKARTDSRSTNLPSLFLLLALVLRWQMKMRNERWKMKEQLNAEVQMYLQG